MTPLSLYLHIPFCRHRCGYCDFNTYAGIETIIPGYITALAAEIRWLSAWNVDKLPLHTVFFGGGTPSLLPAAGIQRILEEVSNSFQLSENVEFSLEANPGTLSLDYLKDLRRLGINRLSIGMQSAHPGELALLEREHSYLDVINSFTWARKSGFDNINLDLIFGLPEQVARTWKRSLDLGLGLHPEHFSLYSLTLEHGTPFGSWSAKGLISQPDPDLAADMYEWACERLAESSYTHYEISNWAKNVTKTARSVTSEFSCQHNLQYWKNLPYLGCGAGAHGYFNGVRTANVLSPYAYIQRMSGSRIDQPKTIEKPLQIDVNSITPDLISSHLLPEFCGSPAAISSQRIDKQTEMDETMMMGLRLVQEGVSNQVFRDRFGISLDEAYPDQIALLQSQGLVEWGPPDDASLCLARKGILLANRVFLEFIS